MSYFIDLISKLHPAAQCFAVLAAAAIALFILACLFLIILALLKSL